MHRDVPLQTTAPSHTPRTWWLWILGGMLAAAFFCLDHNYTIALQKHLLVDQPTEVGELVQDENRFRSVGYLILAVAGTLAWLARPTGGCQWRSLGLWCFLGCYLWCVASVTWSDDPGTTLRRLIPLTLLTYASLGMARHVPIERTWLIGFIVPLFDLIIGLTAELHLRTLRPWEPDFRLCGTSHPNTFGLQLATLILAIVCMRPKSRAGRWSLAALAALAATCLILTKSRTSLGALLVAMAVTWLMQTGVAVRATAFVLLPFLSSFTLLLVMLGDPSRVEKLANVLLLGRSEEAGTLTGRLPLWEHLSWYVRERPWVGYGYGAFWTPQRVLAVSERLDWVIAHAHNAFLEVTLTIGTLGLLLVLIMSCSAFLTALVQYARCRSSGWGFLLGYFIIAFVFSLTEGVYAQHGFARFCLMGCMLVTWLKGATRPALHVDQQMRTSARPADSALNITQRVQPSTLQL